MAKMGCFVGSVNIPRSHRSRRVCGLYMAAGVGFSGGGGGSSGGIGGETKPRMVLIVAELEAMKSYDKSMRDFFERVETHRKANQRCYITLATDVTHGEALQAMQSAEFPQAPDCLITRAGMEIFQKGYRTPDPYYQEQAWKGWDPKPSQWVMKEFFKDQIAEVVEEGEDLRRPLTFVVKEDFRKDLAGLEKEIDAKMSEMGLRNQVLVDEAAAKMRLMPVNSNVSEAVVFMQKMLGAEESSTIVFGSNSSPFIGDFITKTDDLVIVSEAKDASSTTPRIFKTTKLGSEALVEGLRHHAIL